MKTVMIDFYLNLFLLMVMLALPVEKKNELLQMNLPVSKSGSAAKATQNEVLIITVSSDFFEILEKTALGEVKRQDKIAFSDLEREEQMLRKICSIKPLKNVEFRISGEIPHGRAVVMYDLFSECSGEKTEIVLKDGSTKN